MKVVACLGRKGGSGKTMVSHLLAHGLSKAYGVFTNLVMTDVRESRPVDLNPARDYFISSISNRNPEHDAEELDKIFVHTAKVPNSVLIIDGGANRANIDRTFARFCDLIMIPVGYSPEDLDVAMKDYWNLLSAIEEAGTQTRLCIIRNRWPAAQAKQKFLLGKAWVQQFMQQAKHGKMLFPDMVPDMPSLLDMANANDPKTTPLIDGVAARFAEITALALGMELPERRSLMPYNVVRPANGEHGEMQIGKVA
jgi:cellulose biosynthesis protein BcsQ